MKNKAVTLLFILIFKYNLFAHLPYSPLKFIENKIFKIVNQGGILRDCTCVLTIDNDIFYFKNKHGETCKSIALAWLSNGKPMSDDPEVFYESRSFSYLPNYGINISKSGVMRADTSFYRSNDNVELVNSGKNFSVEKIGIGEWKKWKIRTGNKLIVYIMISKNYGIISEYVFNPNGKLESGYEWIRWKRKPQTLPPSSSH